MQYAGGDPAGQRQPGVPQRLGRQPIARDMFGSRVIKPFLLQGLQVAHHAVGRADAEVLADLADRRPVTAVADLVAKEFVDRLLFLGQQVARLHGDSPILVGTVSPICWHECPSLDQKP